MNRCKVSGSVDPVVGTSEIISSFETKRSGWDAPLKVEDMEVVCITNGAERVTGMIEFVIGDAGVCDVRCVAKVTQHRPVT